MKLYRIRLEGTVVETYTVEATDRDEAIDLVLGGDGNQVSDTEWLGKPEAVEVDEDGNEVTE